MTSGTTNEEYVITADIGGSHITSGICNIQTHEILHKSISRFAVMCNSSAENILSTWIKSFKETREQVDVKISGLTIAMPGPFDYANGVSYIKGVNKYDALYGIDVRQYFADNLNLNPSQIRFRNDAEAILAGEVLSGAGSGDGVGSVLGLTLGTGFGSAYFCADTSRDLNLYCIPYKNSIADDFFSTRWFLKRYIDLTGSPITGVREMVEIEKSHEIVTGIFHEFAENLSEFMEEHLNTLKPDLLILGGNIAKSARHFLPKMKKLLPATSIKIAQLGEHAALVGAADLMNKNQRL